MRKKIVGAVAATLVMGTDIPIALASTSVNYHQYKAAITLDEKTISSPFYVVANDGMTDTTYMPMYYIDQAFYK